MVTVVGLALGTGAAYAEYGPPSPQPNRGNGSGVVLGTSSSTARPGAQETVSSTTGPCTAGSPVTIYLLHVIVGQTPLSVGSATANTAGGFGQVTVTIPLGAAPGGYILFAICSGTDGTQVTTVAIVVEPPLTMSSPGVGAARLGAGAVASTFKEEHPSTGVAWSAPSSWATPAVRQISQQVVGATVAALVSGGPAATAPATPGPATTSPGHAGTSPGPAGTSPGPAGALPGSAGASRVDRTAASATGMATGMASPRSAHSDVAMPLALGAGIIGLIAGSLALRRRRVANP